MVFASVQLDFRARGAKYLQIHFLMGIATKITTNLITITMEVIVVTTVAGAPKTTFVGKKV